MVHTNRNIDYLTRRRSETLLGTFVRLYKTKPTFRGLIDFTIAGIIIIPFLVDQRSTLVQSTNSVISEWFSEKPASQPSMETKNTTPVLTKPSNNTSAGPVTWNVKIKIDKKHFASSEAEQQKTLIRAADLIDNNMFQDALALLDSSSRDKNVTFLRGYATLSLGGRVNRNAALDMLQIAAQAGQVQAKTATGLIFVFPPPGFDGHKEKGKTLLNEAAEEGDKFAAFMLGRYYQSGFGGVVDPARALAMFKRGAELGHVESMAQYAMGRSSGIGDKQDFSEAEFWFEKAALKGHIHAQYFLGKLLIVQAAAGVPGGPERGLNWWRKAATAGYDEAIYSLGMYYYHWIKKFGKPDYNQAMHWFEKCAPLGNPDCFLRLGEAFQNGRGKPVDLVAAYAHYVVAETVYRELNVKRGVQILEERIPKIKSRLDSNDIIRANSIIADLNKNRI